jgi:TPR repeat protein
MPDYAAQIAQSQTAWANEREERRARERYERQQQLRREQQQRAAEAAERARLWAIEAEKRRLAEEEKRRERLRFLENWNEVEVPKAGGLLPIEPAPKFADEKAKYDWHLKLYQSGNEVQNFDPYSALVCAQMRLQGRGVERDYAKAFYIARRGLDCKLRYALMGVAATEGHLQSVMDEKEFAAGLVALKLAVQGEDASAGQELAYRQLYRVYFDKAFAHLTVPLDLEGRIQTLVYYVDLGGDEKERGTQQLVQLLNDNKAALPAALPQVQLRELMNALPMETLEQCAPEVQYALARAAQKALVVKYPMMDLPVLKRLDSTSALDDEICLRLYHYTMMNNDRIAQKLVEQMSPRVRERALRHVRQVETIADGSTLDDAMRAIMLDYYIGSLGEAPQPEKAKAWALKMMQNKQADGIFRVAGALRAGRSGWRQSDAEAVAFYENAAAHMTGDQKISGLLTLGYLFGPQEKPKLPQNRALRLKYLEAGYKQSGDKVGRLGLAQALAEDPSQKTRVLALLDAEIASLQETIRLAEAVDMQSLAATVRKMLEEPQALRAKVATQ